VWRGFSLRNLRYMRSFAEAWPDPQILQLAAKLPWGHHMVLLDRLKDGPSREWHLRASIEHGWSRNVLTHHISTRLQEREGKALTNFSRTLPAEDSDPTNVSSSFRHNYASLPAKCSGSKPDPSKLIANVLPNEAIGELLLRSGEMLYKPYVKQPDQMDELANKTALFLPFYEIDSQHDPAAFFLRAYIYLTVIIPTLPANLQTFNIPEMFEAQYKFSLTEYGEFIFMFFMQAMMARGKKSLDVAINSGLHVGLFKNTTLPPASIERMFHSVSFTFDQLASVKPEIGFADFDYLRAQPYFRLGDQLFVSTTNSQ
jgi:hypothetical protein